MDTTKTTIEINGVKFEVDLRTAKRIDTLQVGDRVKVLIKQYSDYKVYPGTVVGFEPFSKLPTVIVAYLEHSYNSADLKFLYFNAETKETEIVKAIDDDQLDLNRVKVNDFFARALAKNEQEHMEILAKQKYFDDNFRAYWTFGKIEADINDH